MSRQEVLPDPRIYSPFLKLMLMLRERGIARKCGGDFDAGEQESTASGIRLPARTPVVGPLLTMILTVSRNALRDKSAKQELETSGTGHRPAQPTLVGVRMCCRVPANGN